MSDEQVLKSQLLINLHIQEAAAVTRPAHTAAAATGPIGSRLMLEQLLLHSQTLHFPGFLDYVCFNIAQWDPLTRLLARGELGPAGSSLTKGTYPPGWVIRVQPAKTPRGGRRESAFLKFSSDIHITHTLR